MALGKIVISSDKTSVEQVITDGHNGFLTKIDDGTELLEKVDYIMSLSQNERKKIGQQEKSGQRNYRRRMCIKEWQKFMRRF